MRPTVTAAALDARLRAADSASEVIGDLFGRPVRVRRLRCDAVPLSPSQRVLLQPAADEPVLHRRVMLLAAGATVSEADLWYLPSRLWPGMAESLRDTDTPFGIVVRDMRPRRQTLATRLGGADEPFMLEHEAVLRDREGRAIALVFERYCVRKEAVLF